MAEARLAQIHSVEHFGSFALVHAAAEEAVGALPGQWGAFHTELPNPLKPGQKLRRAWSFAEVEGAAFALFVAVVGPGTRWLAERRPGDVLPFTGPWGSRFRLDGDDAVGFFAAGSGISAVAPMVDACVARGRPAKLVWDYEGDALSGRLERWQALGVAVVQGRGAAPPEDDRRWWYAGDGARVDAVLAGRAVPPERIERFYTPVPGGST
jgi:hypothetical protein